MTNTEAEKLMRLAWGRRSASFKAEPAVKRVLMTQAKEELTSAVTLCRDRGPAVSHAEAIHLLANVELDMGEEVRAQSLWEEAVSILRGTDESLQLAHKVRHLGDLHLRCKRLADAERCYSEAVALYREHDASGSLDFANALSRLAQVKERRNEKELALALWRETRDQYEAFNMTPGVEEAEEHIARLSA